MKSLIMAIRHILEEKATQTVLEQAEILSEHEIVEQVFFYGFA